MKRSCKAIGLALLVSGSAVCAQELKLATLAPDGSSWMNELRAAADKVEAGSERSVRIRFYPGGVMGDSATVLRRMRLGQLHGGAFTVGDLEKIAPEANLYSVPFLFRDQSELAAVRATFDPIIIEALERGGLIVPGLLNGGFAYLFTRDRPPPADPVGRDFRVWIPPGDQMSRRALEAIGASPVPLAMAEVYTGLQTGTINTFASPPAGAIIMQWHARARYMLDLPVLITAGTVAFDQRAVERLAPAHRALLLSHFAAAILRLEEQNARDNVEALEALQSQGIQIVRPSDADAENWRAITARELNRMLAAGEVSIPGFDQLQQQLRQLREDG